MWMLLVLIYGLLKGVREICKKKALSQNSVMEVLFVYTLLSFIFVLPQFPSALHMELRFYPWIALKSFVIFVAWIVSFISIKKLPVSLYGVLDLSRVFFATSLAIIFLGERLNLFQTLGLVIVCTGFILLRFNPMKRNSIRFSVHPIYVVFALLSCLLNAVSGYMDKVLMKSVTSSELQVWYMTFLTFYYGLYMLIRRIPISSSVWKNKWLYIMAFFFVIADKCLFIGNSYADSRITIMTLIKQSGSVVTILGGRFIFHEKGTGYRLFCASIIVLGIVLGVLNK